jgi:ribosome maturation factor RimP
VQPLEQIRTIAERVAATRGLDVWDIQSRREVHGHVVRVFVDRPGRSATAE